MYHQGDRLARLLAERISAQCADTTAIQAIPSEERVNGMLVFDIADGVPWWFDSTSSAVASGTVLVPTVGSGRWKSISITNAALAALTNGNGASLVGIEDAATIYTATNVEAALAEVKVLANAAAGAIIVHRQVTISQAIDLAGLAGSVKTFDANVGAVLPTNARLMGPPTLTSWTAFDDATHGTFALTVGTSAGGNQIATTQSVASGQTGFPKIMTAGAGGFPMALQSAAQATCRLTSSVDLNTATGGSVIVNLFFLVLA